MRYWIIAVGWLAALHPAMAQSAPTGLIGGEIASASSAPNCFVNAGAATFQRNFNYKVASGTKAVASFPSAYCGNANMSGHAVLNFTSATGGNISFTRFPNTPLATQGTDFADYSETVNPATHQIVVKFNIPHAWPVTLTLDPSYP